MLIGLTILAVGILAVVTMQVTSLRNNALSFSRTEAASVGQGMVEDLMARAFNDPLLQDTNGDGAGGLAETGNNADFSTALTVNNIAYQLSWNISTNDPVQNTLTLGLIVQWPYAGVQRTLTLTQIIGR